VWASFKLEAKDIMVDAAWKCRVTDPLPWLKSGEVACIANRPRKPHPDGPSDEKKIPRDFITGNLPSGNGQRATDGELRKELDKARMVQVRFRLETSSQTYRR
jgi:hypothetical protein